MFRPRSIALVLSLSLFASLVRADNKASPFYTLPADGTWVEYDWKRLKPDKKEEQGTMRLSCVGSKDVEGVRARWIEIKVESKHGEQVKWQRRKLLVAEKAFTDGKPLEECVLDCFHQDDGGGPVTRLSKKRTGEFLRLNLASDDPTLKEVKAKVEIMTGLGKVTARQVSAGGRGEKTQTYQAWLSDDVPFGVAKFEIHEQGGEGQDRLAFTATVQRTGKGAKCEVDETNAK